MSDEVKDSQETDIGQAAPAQQDILTPEMAHKVDLYMAQKFQSLIQSGKYTDEIHSAIANSDGKFSKTFGEILDEVAFDETMQKAGVVDIGGEVNAEDLLGDDEEGRVEFEVGAFKYNVADDSLECHVIHATTAFTNLFLYIFLAPLRLFKKMRNTDEQKSADVDFGQFEPELVEQLRTKKVFIPLPQITDMSFLQDMEDEDEDED